MTTESLSSAVNADSKNTTGAPLGDAPGTIDRPLDAATNPADPSVLSRFEKLRQAMEAVADKARPQQIHALRTSSRRVMAALSLLDARVESEVGARVTTPVKASLAQLQTQVHQLQASGEALSLELARPLKKARKSAEKLSEAFAHVRDLDVARSLIAELNRELATEGDSDDPAISDLQRWLKKRRKRMAEQASSWLSTRRVRRLRKRITRAAASVTALETSGERMVAMLEATREELLAQLPVLKGGTLDEKALHAARISARRLRYSLELWSNPAAEKALQALQNLQDLLGAHRDWSRLEDLMTARRSRLLQSERLPDVRHAMAALEPVLRRRVDSLALRFPSLSDQLEQLLQALPLRQMPDEVAPTTSNGASEAAPASSEPASTSASGREPLSAAPSAAPAAPSAPPETAPRKPRAPGARRTSRSAAGTSAGESAAPASSTPEAVTAPAAPAAETPAPAKASSARKKPASTRRAKAPAAPAPATPSPVTQDAASHAATTGAGEKTAAPAEGAMLGDGGGASAALASTPAAKGSPGRKPAAPRKPRASAAPSTPAPAEVAPPAPARTAARTRKAASTVGKRATAAAAVAASEAAAEVVSPAVPEGASSMTSEPSEG